MVTNLDNYTPEIIGNEYATFLVKLERCPLCNCLMIAEPKQQHFRKSTFPVYCKLSFETQAKRANLHFVSNIIVDDEYICIECADEGKADFLCSLCKNRKSTDKEKESFGDPPEYLCKDCYSTVPAKEWDKKCEMLEESHRWDFE